MNASAVALSMHKLQVDKNFRIGTLATGVTPDEPAPIPKLKRGRTMNGYSELFIGLDTSKAKILRIPMMPPVYSEMIPPTVPG